MTSHNPIQSRVGCTHKQPLTFRPRRQRRARYQITVVFTARAAGGGRRGGAINRSVTPSHLANVGMERGRKRTSGLRWCLSDDLSLPIAIPAPSLGWLILPQIDSLLWNSPPLAVIHTWWAGAGAGAGRCCGRLLATGSLRVCNSARLELAPLRLRGV